jgi:hypothetical protein
LSDGGAGRDLSCDQTGDADAIDNNPTRAEAIKRRADCGSRGIKQANGTSEFIEILIRGLCDGAGGKEGLGDFAGRT